VSFFRIFFALTVAAVADILGDVKPLIYFVQCTLYEFAKATLAQLQAKLNQTDITGVYANDGHMWKDRKWEGDKNFSENVR